MIIGSAAAGAHRRMETAATAAPALLLSATLLLNTVSALQCYECSEQPVQINPNKTVKLCSEFDGSRRFVVDCPHSTFCRKTSIELPILNGERIKSVKRDCAPQHNRYQVLENSVWKEKTETVTTLYTEGCDKQDADVQATTAEYCYCSSYLCNSSKSNHDPSYSHHSDAMAVIFVFNAMKYIRSLR